EVRVLAVVGLTVRLRDVEQVDRLLALVRLGRECLLERLDGLVEVAQVVLVLAFLVPVAGSLGLGPRQRRHQQDSKTDLPHRFSRQATVAASTYGIAAASAHRT